jgi:hypothetical protein
MRFELKHKQLNDTAKYLTYRKNVCYTLALKQNFVKNKIFHSTKLGRHILITPPKLKIYNNSELLTNSFNFLIDNYHSFLGLILKVQYITSTI